MTTEVYGVNAFVAGGRGGNLAGVVLDASSLNEQQMQSIAHQVGASETAFVLPDKEATHMFRFFTPTTEVPLCGHATIASWWLMRKLGIHKPGSYAQNNLEGLTNISVDEDGKVFMEQPVQELRGYVETDKVIAALQILENKLNKGFRPQIMQRQLMVCLNTAEELESLQPDLELVEKVSEEHDFFGFHVFVLLEGRESIASVRNFCPRVGISEDAATGTGNGSFLEYLRYYNKLPPQEIYRIEQGKAMGRLSHIYGKFQGDRVWIGGDAIETKHLEIEV